MSKSWRTVASVVATEDEEAHRARVAKRRIWSDLFTLGSLHRVDAEERAVVDDLIDSLGLFMMETYQRAREEVICSIDWRGNCRSPTE